MANGYCTKEENNVESKIDKSCTETCSGEGGNKETASKARSEEAIIKEIPKNALVPRRKGRSAIHNVPFLPSNSLLAHFDRLYLCFTALDS